LDITYSSVEDANVISHAEGLRKRPDIRYHAVMSERVAVEEVVARFPAGTLSDIDTVLSDGENRSAFIRTAVAAEIARRKGEK
jgi:hypothetical protein